MTRRRRRSSNARATEKNQGQKIVRIAINDIIVPENRREYNSDRVAEIAAAMAVIGLQSPVTVRKKKGQDKPMLVTGLHRLKAASLLGWKDIDAIFMSGSKLDAKLWAIAENLCRAELPALERAEHVERWIKLVKRRPSASEDIVGKRRSGRPKGGIAEAARELPVTGKSEEARRKAIERDLKIARITSEAKKAAKEAGLHDNLTALLAIAKEPNSEKQLAKAHELSNRKSESGTRISSSSRKRVSKVERAIRQVTKLWRGLQNVHPATRRFLVDFLIRGNEEFAYLRQAEEHRA